MTNKDGNKMTNQAGPRWWDRKKKEFRFDTPPEGRVGVIFTPGWLPIRSKASD